MMNSVRLNQLQNSLRNCGTWSLLIYSAAATLITGTALIPQATFAYKGDPSVQGPNYTEERHETMTTTFENNDYATWKDLMAGKGVANRITEETFSRFAEAHQLAAEGKTAESEAIRAELGLGLKSGSG